MAIQYRSRIHPLIAAAAVSTTLVSVMGIAALSGVLPWMPGAAPQKFPSTARLPGDAASSTAIVLPTASVKPPTPLTAADSLAPGETLIAADTPAAPRAVQVPTVPATPIAAASISAQPALAGPKLPATPLTLAKTMTPTTPQSTSAVRPENVAAPRTVVAVSSPRAAPQVRQQQLQVTEASSVQSTQSPRERQRAREAALMTSSGNSTGGSTGSGAGLRSSRGPTQSYSTNDPQLYSDARRTSTSVSGSMSNGASNGAPRITPIYRADAPADSVPLTNNQEQQSPQSQRAGNRTAGEVTIVSERSRAEPTRRYAGSDREAAPATYPVASGYSSDPGTGNTVGTAIGRTVSKGIDKTISVISDVLNGRYVPPPPAEPQDSIYR